MNFIIINVRNVDMSIVMIVVSNRIFFRSEIKLDEWRHLSLFLSLDPRFYLICYSILYDAKKNFFFVSGSVEKRFMQVNASL